MVLTAGNTMPEETPAATAIEEPSRVERDRQMIVDARQQGTGSLMWAFTKLSGPGWLQSAITLGGGSLAGSLYLGVLAGYNLMWLQPLAMILGVVMLSAIGYVTLSTGERPFGAINRHISPVLGWGWALASLMANLVWCMPQFALGTAAITQNLSPEGIGGMDPVQGKLVCTSILFVAAGIVVWFYDSGGWGIKLFEFILKAMVGTVVICFFGVVIKMSTVSGGLDWSGILGGFIPDFSLLSEPSPAFAETLTRSGEFATFWKERIVSDQQQVMITAAATAVGINMTFLLPYSMLARGWDRDFRGLAIFDLATGLFVPFMLATGCVVIAAATQFHATPEPGLVGYFSENPPEVEPAGNVVKGYGDLLDARLAQELGQDEFDALKADPEQLKSARAALPLADREMAAMLVKRDAFNLADSLKPIAGDAVAQYVFGVGVLGMAISTIIILMLINGFVVCEIFGLPPKGTPHRVGAFLAAFTGAMGPFFWSEAAVWLAVPTSMFGMVLLPIAYFAFFFLMNSRSLLGQHMPTGLARLRWNLLMLLAAGLATFGSLWSIWSSPYPYAGLGVMGAFIVLALVVRAPRTAEGETTT
ncbi:Natural resistance-associated macrophage protein [Maioricimonas rarisocia]|uniref:Natural resistance-associated macrophage protein n=2 Tax=Maioricimonas rarisocia TaxID=2528026 RepID=A0A517Z6U3_9PLAN|nr:Natural resistance-associated macrophage protein [Maioricimonas rarisocia]